MSSHLIGRSFVQDACDQREGLRALRRPARRARCDAAGRSARRVRGGGALPLHLPTLRPRLRHVPRPPRVPVRRARTFFCSWDACVLVLTPETSDAYALKFISICSNCVIALHCAFRRFVHDVHIAKHLPESALEASELEAEKYAQQQGFISLWIVHHLRVVHVHLRGFYLCICKICNHLIDWSKENENFNILDIHNVDITVTKIALKDHFYSAKVLCKVEMCTK